MWVYRALILLFAAFVGYKGASIMARLRKASCPVSITEKIFGLLGGRRDSSFPVLRRVAGTKKGAYFFKSLAISSSSIRGNFRKFLRRL